MVEGGAGWVLSGGSNGIVELLVLMWCSVV